MNRTLTVVPGDGKRGVPRSYRGRWSATGKVDPIAVAVAPRLGVGVRQATRRLHSCFEEVAIYVEAFRALGDLTRLERHMGPVLKAYQEREAPPLVPATYRLETEADGREDTDVQAFQMEPTRATCARAIRSLDTSILRQVALRDALRAEETRLLGCAR